MTWCSLSPVWIHIKHTYCTPDWNKNRNTSLTWSLSCLPLWKPYLLELFLVVLLLPLCFFILCFFLLALFFIRTHLLLFFLQGLKDYMWQRISEKLIDDLLTELKISGHFEIIFLWCEVWFNPTFHEITNNAQASSMTGKQDTTSSLRMISLSTCGCLRLLETTALPEIHNSQN